MDFKRKFENPILKGRDSDATDAQKKKGEEKLAEVFLSLFYELTVNSKKFPLPVTDSLFCLLLVCSQMLFERSSFVTYFLH